MEISRPLIMITNDDSVEAPGIHHLVECVREFGDVYVVAPAHPHSGQSSALTVGAPLRIRESPLWSNTMAPSYTRNRSSRTAAAMDRHTLFRVMFFHL